MLELHRELLTFIKQKGKEKSENMVQTAKGVSNLLGGSFSKGDERKQKMAQAKKNISEGILGKNNLKKLNNIKKDAKNWF